MYDNRLVLFTSLHCDSLCPHATCLFYHRNAAPRALRGPRSSSIGSNGIAETCAENDKQLTTVLMNMLHLCCQKSGTKGSEKKVKPNITVHSNIFKLCKVKLSHPFKTSLFQLSFLSHAKWPWVLVASE